MTESMTQMPMQKLIAYQVAKELLLQVRACDISEPKLRDQAMRAAQSSCLNIAEVASGEAWEEEA